MGMNKIKILCVTTLILLASCKQKAVKQSYLALGDSYTQGEAVSESERWPVQLAKALENENVTIAPPKIIAQTGWTTDELKKGIDEAVLDYPYDWVSLLIGVNNQYRGYNLATFKTEFEELLTQSILFAGNKKERVFVVSIPDWGVMPFAKNRDQEQIATEIDNFNQELLDLS